MIFFLNILKDNKLNFTKSVMKAVITCGGMGTRLLPFTKELPKEMAPIFYHTENGIQVKPLIQLIFENLYDAGIREFCFVTGKTKRAIENHYIPDILNNKEPMFSFYKKLSNSKIYWVTQNSPKGFGDAVKFTKSFIGNEDFILQAGDVAVIQNESNFLSKLINQPKDSQQGAILSVRKVSDPKRHGIVILENTDQKISRVTQAIEKPDSPPTNFGIMPIYLFDHSIFTALENIQPGKNNEIQLTDAIQLLINSGKNVKAIRVDKEMFWDVGTPEAYWEALNESHSYKAKQ